MRMITYSVNWMGPINKEWIERHGSYWSGGRIDIREHVSFDHLSEEEFDHLPEDEYYSMFELSPWGEEYGLPIMHSDDWFSFGKWLREYKTEKLVPYAKIIADYEKDNPTIRWFTK